jgi:hypothetical protein
VVLKHTIHGWLINEAAGFMLNVFEWSGGSSEECEETERMVQNSLKKVSLYMLVRVSKGDLHVATRKSGYEVGGIEPVRTVLRIPIQYLLMGTSNVKKKYRDQCPGFGVTERNPTGNTIREYCRRTRACPGTVGAHRT